MAKRKAISKKTRFEVFKRDSFTCQYCGRKSPDVLLHIDHIKPVCKGGDNDIINLTTSCSECNGGKGGRELSDDSVVVKQRMALEEHQKKNEQIEMMVQWKVSMIDTHKKEIDGFNEYMVALSGKRLSEFGIKSIRKHINKYGLLETMEAFGQAYEQYSKRENPVEESLNKLGGFLANRARAKTDKYHMPAWRLTYIGRSLWSDTRQRWIDVYECVHAVLELGYTEDEVKKHMHKFSTLYDFSQNIDDIEVDE